MAEPYVLLDDDGLAAAALALQLEATPKTPADTATAETASKILAHMARTWARAAVTAYLGAIAERVGPPNTTPVVVRSRDEQRAFIEGFEKGATMLVAQLRKGAAVHEAEQYVGNVATLLRDAMLPQEPTPPGLGGEATS